MDALANALAPVFRAEPRPGRVAVAMSGGVDSAVALLRAGPRTRSASRLRLWLDPQGPDAERACCSPEAVIAARADLPPARDPARHARPARGVPPRGRRAVRRAATRRGETPNPCIRCNGSFRFAELLAFAERAGAERLATGHYARIVERDGRLLLARAADERKDQSYMLGRLDPRFLDRLWFPLGEQGKDETRAEAARAGLEAAGRAESQEACFLAGGDYRDFLERHGLAAADGPVVDEQGNELGRHAGFWRFTPGQRKGPRRRGGRAALRAAQRAADERRRRRPARRARHDRGVTPAGGCTSSSIARRRSSATARPRSARASPATEGGFRLDLDRPAYGVAPGQAAVLYDEGAVVGAGTILVDPAETVAAVPAFESEGE